MISLKNPGKISKELADKKAFKEFKKYRKIQDKIYVSDFDKRVKKYLGNGDT